MASTLLLQRPAPASLPLPRIPLRLTLPPSPSRHPFSTAPRRAEKNEQPKIVYSRPTTLNVDRKRSPIRIWPFLVILGAGFYGFNLLVKERTGTKPTKESDKASSKPF